MRELGLILESKEGLQTSEFRFKILGNASKNRAQNEAWGVRKWAYALIAASIPLTPSIDIKRLKL